VSRSGSLVRVQIPDAPLRCRDCGEIIGSYEPLIVREDYTVRETSRVAEPGLATASGEYYHRACHLAGRAEAGTSESR
jgi:hypothetical protein